MNKKNYFFHWLQWKKEKEDMHVPYIHIMSYIWQSITVLGSTLSGKFPVKTSSVPEK